MNWIQLVQDRVRWKALLNMVWTFGLSMKWAILWQLNDYQPFKNIPWNLSHSETYISGALCVCCPLHLLLPCCCSLHLLFLFGFAHCKSVCVYWSFIVFHHQCNSICKWDYSIFFLRKCFIYCVLNYICSCIFLGIQIYLLYQENFL